MKTAIILTLIGALTGIAIASWVVPPALSWYTEPGGLPNGAQVQSLVVVPDVIHYATSRLIRGQLIGAVGGALAGLVLGIVFARRARANLVRQDKSPQERSSS
jgi:hypothetical protein